MAGYSPAVGNPLGGGLNAGGLLMAVSGDVSTTVEASEPQGNDRVGRTGGLLGGIAIAIYLLFTFLPNSGLMVMSWPYPVLLLVGWVSAALWGLVQWFQARPPRRLGMGLDWAVGLTAIALAISTLGSQWPQLAGWNAAQFAFHAIAFYGLAQWLSTPERRLWMWRATAWVGVLFALESLLLWWVYTLSPELARIHQLQTVGLPASLDFSRIELQNIWPIFHQNYVAGFLLLVIPAAAGLAWLNRRSPLRWMWMAAVAIELVDLWSTQSRAAWLGAAVVVVSVAGVGVARGLKRWKWRLGAMAIIVGGAIAFLLGNPRLNQSLTALRNGSLHTFAFRGAAVEATWNAVRDRTWLGSGPGTAAWTYLEHKPAWTGLFAQTMAHMHSTPLQVLVELGGLGLVVMLIWLLALGRVGWWLGRKGEPKESNTDCLWSWVLMIGLLGYGIEALADYQLDVTAIAGYLVVAIAGLAALSQTAVGAHHPLNRSRQTAIGAIAIAVLAISSISLIPRYTAWGISSQGLEAYFDNEIGTAEATLIAAYQRFPAEPFYPIQLGWLDAKIAREHPDAGVRQIKHAEAIAWFKRSLELLPNDEFVHTNLGYLLLESDPAAAIPHFQRSLELSPARAWVAAGLGVAHLQVGDREEGIAALSRELIRHPAAITSPLWEQVLAPTTYTELVQTLDRTYADLVDRYPQHAYLRWNWAAVRWWLNDVEGAEQLLQPDEQPLL
ncbi:MAG: O-antigen ligase family protein, partial [Cyanobacteria bacterium P01_A01_bin.3]